MNIVKLVEKKDTVQASQLKSGDLVQVVGNKYTDACLGEIIKCTYYKGRLIGFSLSSHNYWYDFDKSDLTVRLLPPGTLMEVQSDQDDDETDADLRGEK